MKIKYSARFAGVLCALVCSAMFLNCGGISSTNTNHTSTGAATLSQINISPANKSIAKGTKLQLSAKGIFSDGTQKDISSVVQWNANPSTIAAVSAHGDVTGVAEGVAQIGAAYEGISGSATIKVGSAALLAISVNAPQSALAMGQWESMTATGSFSDGTKQDLTQLAAWQSSPVTVATIHGPGAVTGVGKGIAQVSAAYQGLSGNVSISVGSAVLMGISVSAPHASLPLGESESLTAIGSFSDGSTQNLTQSVAWNSSAPGVASVAAGGATVAKTVGTATMSASLGTVSGAANLTVTSAVATSLNVNPANSSLLLGKSGQLQAIATFSDGTTQDVTSTATWSSQQPNIVAAGSGGVVTAQLVGSATITATSSTLSGSGVINVTPLMNVSYFNRVNTVTSGIDNTLRLVNPGVTGADLCAMIYVFDRNQEMNECCGCKISQDGERTFSLVTDLTSNPLTGIPPVAGSIEIVPADPDRNGQCNAASPTPDGMLAGWETNVQTSNASYQTTETECLIAPLPSTQAQVLATECAMIGQLGSGAGVCYCGSGD